MPNRACDPMGGTAQALVLACGLAHREALFAADCDVEVVGVGMCRADRVSAECDMEGGHTPHIVAPTCCLNSCGPFAVRSEWLCIAHTQPLIHKVSRHAQSVIGDLTTFKVAGVPIVCGQSVPSKDHTVPGSTSLVFGARHKRLR